MTDPNRVLIFDTTLRDGEQSPGATMSHAEKLEIAEMLDEMGVDIIEAGFPITSDGDFDCVAKIAREVRGPVIAALARTHKLDIERAAQAIAPAERGRIHIFTSASDPTVNATSGADKYHNLRWWQWNKIGQLYLQEVNDFIRYELPTRVYDTSGEYSPMRIQEILQFATLSQNDPRWGRP